MLRTAIQALLLLWIGLGGFPYAWADNRKPDHPPAEHPDFSVVENSPTGITLRYDSPNATGFQRFSSPIYIGVPIDATYTFEWRDWRFTLRDRSRNSDSQPLSSGKIESTTYAHQLLDETIDAKRHAFHELDIIKVEISPNQDLPASLSSETGTRQRLHLDFIEFSLTWDQPAASSHSASPRQDAGFARLFDQLCVNREHVHSMRGKRTLDKQEARRGFSPAMIGYDAESAALNGVDEAIPPRENALRVLTDQGGVIAIRPADIAEMGMDPTQVDLPQTRLWHQGQEITAAVRDDNGVFDGDDQIAFYAEESDSEFTRFGHYYLTWDEQATPPKRAERLDPLLKEQPAQGDENAFVQTRLVFDDDRMLVKEGMKQFGWYYANIDAVTKTIPLSLPGIAPEGEVSVTVKTYNNARKPTGFQLRMGEGWRHFTAQVNQATSMAFVTPASSVIEQATLQVILDEPPAEVSILDGASAKVSDIPHIFIDAIEVSYPRMANLADGPLRIERALGVPERLRLQTTDENQTLSLWTVHEGELQAVSRMSPTRPRSVLSLPPQPWNQTWLFDDTSLPGPHHLERDTPSTLHHADQGYDLVYVAHNSLIEAVRPLAQQRSQEGFEVLLVDVQDIYDEFNFGYPSYHAIKRFFRYAQAEWQGRSPEFITLVGDSSWDHRDREGTNFEDQVPTFAPLDDPQRFGSDEWYAYLWGGEKDEFPDLILGRISVRSPQEVSNYLQKVRTYETQTPVGPWRAQNLFITDDGFERYAFDQAEESLPPVLQPTYVNQIDYPHVTNPYLYHRFMDSTDPREREYLNKKFSPETTLAILDALNQGALLVQYIGHGGNQLWSHERIFYGTERPTSNVLEIEPHNRYPFIVNWSCLTGYLNFNKPPFHVCLAEEFIRHGDRGAIAVWAPSGGGTTDQHMILSHLMTRNLIEDGLRRFGEAIAMSKTEYLSVSYSHELVDQYVLFGDPTLSLALPHERLDLQVDQAHYYADQEQSFSVNAAIDSMQEGQALIACTVGGKTIYQSEPLAFTEGTISHSFTATPPQTTEGEAVFHLYAWNAEQNLDAWGSATLPMVEVELQLAGGRAARANGQLGVEFQVVNPTSFNAENIRFELDLGGELIPLTAGSIPAQSTQTLQWQGAHEDDLQYAFVRINEKPSLLLPESDVKDRLAIEVPQPQDTPTPSVVPLIGKIRFTAHELIAGETVRLRAPFVNHSDESQFIRAVVKSPRPAQDVREVTLTAHEERELDFSIQLPDALGDAAFELHAFVDGATTVYPFEKMVWGKPDLALAEGDFVVTPDPPVIGKTVKIRTNIYNVGQGPAHDIRLDAYLGDPSQRQRLNPFHGSQRARIEELGPSGMQAVELTWDPEGYEGLGTNQIYLVVDPTGRIEETDESNNRIPLTLTMVDLPDLKVSPWAWHRMELLDEAELPVWGSTLRLHGRMQNVGESAATYARLSLMHNEREYPHIVEELPPDDYAETHFDVPLVSSRNDLSIIADQYDLVGEKDETQEMGNNLSRTRRVDYELQMPVPPISQGERVYPVKTETHFTAGKMEYLTFDEKRQALAMIPTITDFPYRIAPFLVQNKDAYKINAPDDLWNWNPHYNVFNSPVRGEEPLRAEIPTPLGEFDVSLRLYSRGYERGATSAIQVKTPSDTDFVTIQHEEGGGENGYYSLGRYNLASDTFPIDFRGVNWPFATDLSDVRFVRADDDSPITTHYVSPYFPASDADGPATLTWEAEIPEGTNLTVRARWVRKREDGGLQFLPWASATPGQQGKLTVIGQGDYIQYSVVFTLNAPEFRSAAFGPAQLSIPVKETAQSASEIGASR